MKYPLLIILSHPLHSFPECTWTRLIFWILVVWLSYPTLFICLQGPSVRQLIQLFKYHFEYPIPSAPVRRTWTWSIQVVWILLFWLGSSYPTLFIRLQIVRQHASAQLFEHPRLIILSHPLHPSPACTWTCSMRKKKYPLSDHRRIPSSPECTWDWANCLNTRHLIIQSTLSVSRINGRKYVNLLNCLNTPGLIWLSHPILSRPKYVNLVNSSCLNTPFLIILSPSLSVSRRYVNLINYLSTVHLIIISYWFSLYLSTESTWNFLIVWIPSIWSSSLHLQNVRVICQLFKTSNLSLKPSSPPDGTRTLVNLLDAHHLIVFSHRLHPSPESTWSLSID